MLHIFTFMEFDLFFVWCNLQTLLHGEEIYDDLKLRMCQVMALERFIKSGLQLFRNINKLDFLNLQT